MSLSHWPLIAEYPDSLKINDMSDFCRHLIQNNLKAGLLGNFEKLIDVPLFIGFREWLNQNIFVISVLLKCIYEKHIDYFFKLTQ